MSRTILRIDSSANGDNSATKALADQLVAKISADGDTVVVRDLSVGVPLLDADTLANAFLPAADRSPETADRLALADQLIAELQAADVLVVSAPIYNFSVPASLKAWADLVARAGVTFQYSENGAEGLVADRPTYIVTAAGGVPIGSDADFGTGWLRLFLGFLGITQVELIAAEGLAMDAEGGMARASEAIAAVA